MTAADITCTTGEYDTKDGNCITAAAGWSRCPSNYVTCICKKGTESFCTLPQVREHAGCVEGVVGL